MKKTIIFIIFITIITVITPWVYAQTVLPLTVAPARQEVIINPGEKTAINVRFYNFGEAPVSGLLKIADFIVEGKEGTPRIIENMEQANPRFSASNWLTIPYDRITIAANDKVAFQGKIQVPENARPGGRYIAIYFEPTGALPPPVGGEKEAGTGVAARIASLVYVRVKGPITEKALVSRFFAKNFYEYGPIAVETEILNRGDYHIRPLGTISLTNIFGNLIAQDKLKEQNIFPDTFRAYENQLGQKWMLGKYKISLAAGYGETGQALTGAGYVWVFPWRVATVIALALLILFLLARNFYKKVVVKEAKLEEELEQEKEEIEKLREMLKKRE